MSVTDIELDLDCSAVKVKILRDSLDIPLDDGKIEPLKEGMEIELPRWAARKLRKNNLVEILEPESLDTTALSKIHWRECIPSSREIPPMQYDFYYRLRHLLFDLSERAQQESSRRDDFERALSQSKDIVNCRLHKILYFAAAPPQAEAMVHKMAAEERALYNQLSSIVNDWKSKILSLEDE